MEWAGFCDFAIAPFFLWASCLGLCSLFFSTLAPKASFFLVFTMIRFSFQTCWPCLSSSFWSHGGRFSKFLVEKIGKFLFRFSDVIFNCRTYQDDTYVRAYVRMYVRTYVRTHVHTYVHTYWPGTANTKISYLSEGR